jgi:hypothetical protein
MVWFWRLPGVCKINQMIEPMGPLFGDFRTLIVLQEFVALQHVFV